MDENSEVRLVAFSELEIVCERCQAVKQISSDDAFFFVSKFGEAEGWVCNACAVSESDRLVPVRQVRPLMFEGFLEPPMVGSFSPLLDSDGSPKRETEPFWVDLGAHVLETMAMMPGKVLKHTIASQRLRGLWIKPTWNGARVAALTAAGDTTQKKLVLDVYQTTRLVQLGFKETGTTNKTWHLELSEPEQGISNAASVIIHTLKYGYLLNPADIQNITETLDIDLDDPEYQHMRRPKSD